MLMLEQVRDWLKDQDPELDGCIAVGSIDGNKEKFIGIYPLKSTGGSQKVCLGGPEQTRYQERSVSILIHWSKSMTEAETKANAIYGLFYGLAGVMMGTTPVISVNPGPAPIPAGRDAHGIYEYVIQLRITYERT